MISTSVRMLWESIVNDEMKFEEQALKRIWQAWFVEIVDHEKIS